MLFNLSLYMYGISCYTNQRLCTKIQNETHDDLWSTPNFEVRRTSMSSYIDSSNEVSSWRVTTTTSRVPGCRRRTHDDTLALRIRVRRRHRDPLEVVGATTTPPLYEELWPESPSISHRVFLRPRTHLIC